MPMCSSCQREFQSDNKDQTLCDKCHSGNKNLEVLLSGGDWACALGDSDVLAEVAKTLFPCVVSPLQVELVEIAKLAYHNFAEASKRWVQLSGHLRAHLMMASRDFGKYKA